MEHINERDADATAILTTESVASHYGIPVLRIEIEAAGMIEDYGPADLVQLPDWPQAVPAAYIVAGWAMRTDRSADERDAARRYCAQWPDGPQVV